MTISWHDILGSTGVVIVLVFYLLLQIEKVAAMIADNRPVE